MSLDTGRVKTMFSIRLKGFSYTNANERHGVLRDSFYSVVPDSLGAITNIRFVLYALA